MTDSLVLDAGALIALDRNDRGMWAVLRVAADSRRIVQVPAGVIAQAWRDGARQALLSRSLRLCEELALDGQGARAAGLLCAKTGTADVVDASVAVAAASLTHSGTVALFTSDVGDITLLLDSLGAKVRVAQV